MKRYVALLRGINISGRNKVPMAELKKEFEKLQFGGVKTYLNSGNVLFSSEKGDTEGVTKQRNTLETTLWLKNIREGYTRAAILESGIAFNCTLLVSRNAQEKFESNIKSENNRLTIEIKFNIITDKNVVTKCKCRAYCGYQNNNGVITWKSEKPMTFFYGHELKRNDEILAL